MCYSEILVEQEQPLSNYQREIELSTLSFDVSSLELLPDYPGGYLVISANSQRVISIDFVRPRVKIDSAA